MMPLRPYWLFLDDLRKPLDVKWIVMPVCAWTTVRDYEAFIKIITERGLPEHVSFDHDIRPGHYDVAIMLDAGDIIDYQYDYSRMEKTGYHCAQWLVSYCMDHHLPLPPYTVHSMNPVGAANIESLLSSFNAKRTDLT